MVFRKLRIKNFMAIGECELDLQNRGFVRIKGLNNTDPNTTGCGTGKSSIANALNWVLTNQTVKGGTDVKNQYSDGDCYVQVQFEKDGKEYQIKRTKGKSIQLIENGVDCSGKGIRDTQELIEQKFPEFTPEFIGATVIFGQRQPNAFTANPASKRKEILEKLTRSDFQIEEIKERLSKMKLATSKQQRNAEDERLKTEVKLYELKKLKDENVRILDSLRLPPDIDQQIINLKSEREVLQSQLILLLEKEHNIQNGTDSIQKAGTDLSDKLRAYEKTQSEKKERALAELQSSKEKAIKTARDQNEVALKTIRDVLAKQNEKLKNSEIDKSTMYGNLQLVNNKFAIAEQDYNQALSELETLKKSTKCPTCGKPWGDDEHKIDLTPYEAKVVDKMANVCNEASLKDEAESDYMNALKTLKLARNMVVATEQEVCLKETEQAVYLNNIEKQEQLKIDAERNNWDNDKSAIEMNEQLSSLRNEYVIQREKFAQNKNEKEQCESTIKAATIKIEEFERKVSDYKNKVSDLTERIKLQSVDEKKFEKEYATETTQIDYYKTKAEQLNKLQNFAVKKFRTILLEDIIALFERKAKYYAHKYFDVDVSFKQEASNIEITYQGKQFENLSGGEECAAVLVIQTALRELLSELMGDESNLLFIDECTDAADITLSERIMNLVCEYNTSSVFIISHRDELNIPADSTLYVIKDDNIAHIETTY
ncbi:MAG: AAA family ATPase [Christensenellaceae bacterium]|jgi:DNA repair exonuclease SbcCD ATPase subunit|nr:AAA family ATPase [Christensenellaceae bacterium]